MSERRPRPSGDGSGLPGTRCAVAADGRNLDGSWTLAPLNRAEVESLSG
jgi:hypothetical protein